MPRAPRDLPGPACPPWRSSVPLCPRGLFHIPDADPLPDLLSGCSANGYSGKSPLPGASRGPSGIDGCKFWGQMMWLCWTGKFCCRDLPSWCRMAPSCCCASPKHTMTKWGSFENYHLVFCK